MRRRSEICGFTFDDLTETPRKGPAIRLVKSKTDQEGASKLIPISQGLFDLILRWKSHAEIEGTVLRSVDRHGNVGPQLRSGSICTILNQLLAKTSLPDNKAIRPLFRWRSNRFGGSRRILGDNHAARWLALQ